MSHGIVHWKSRVLPHLFIGGIIAMLCCGLSAQAAFAIRSRTVAGVRYVYLADVATYYGMKMARKDKALILASTTRRLSLTINSRKAEINDVVADLAYATREDGGVVLLAERDLAIHLDPILRPNGQPRRTVRRIVIDPGHGDKDAGASGSFLQEKNLTLEISKRLKTRLEKLGFQVILTRSSDVFLELPDRPAVARKQKADLFLSIHINSAKSATASGIETYFVTPQNVPSSGQTDRQKDAVAGNSWDMQNTLLAWNVQRHLIAQTGAVDRGIKRYRWRVLLDPASPALLVELGFVSNSAEERLLGTSAYQEKLVAGIANGIVGYQRAVAPKSR